MTQKTLLTKLREHPATKFYGFTYETLKRVKRPIGGDNLYVVVYDGSYPVAILRYRLDIDFFVDVSNLQQRRFGWDCYKAWQLAIAK